MYSFYTIGTVLLGASLVRGAAINVRGEQPACTSDACGNAFTMGLGLPRQQQATSFCSSFMTDDAPQTVTSTSTAQVTNTVTITGTSTVTTTTTSYGCPVPLKHKRADQSTPAWASSACTATGTVRAEARLSSACSCMGITGRPAGTATVVQTVTETGAPITTTINPTVTQTVSDPYHPSPTNLLKNAGFEQGLDQWSIRGYDSYAKIKVASPGKDSNNTLQVDLTSPGGEWGSNYFAGAILSQPIPQVGKNYHYVLSFDYNFLYANGAIHSCDAYVWLGAEMVADRWRLNGFRTPGWNQWSLYYDSRKVETKTPLKIALECFWDLNEPAGTTKATFQVDNLVWTPQVGCYGD